MVTHRINRVEFELEVSAVELGRHVSDRVSVLHGQRISSLLDRVCSEADDSEQIDRIDTLELNLGSIELANFDDELLRRLEAALRLALRERPGRARAQQGVPGELRSDTSQASERTDAQRRADDAHALLDGYAWTGSLPWWADARAPDVLMLPIRELLVHAPTRWLELLREHAEDRVGLDRLARACDAELFEAILERAGASETLGDLRVLEQLLVLVGSRPGLARAPLLGVLATHGRLDAAAVLPAVLRELEADVAAALAELIDTQPELGTAAVRAAIASTVSQQQQGTGEQAGRSPADARATTEPTTDTVELVGRTTPNTRAADELAAPSPAGLPETSHLDPAREPPQPARLSDPNRSPARASTDDPQLQHARRRALARLDELYVEDAGLVILWPFIERLFTRVELLDEHRRFRDDAAQTQAIALLAYLALANPEPPEHQLAFAKLLCGRSPEQPCQLQRPLDPELCEECDLLLAAVIDHAPVLDSMPILRFRASFLQRSGALSVRAGSWILSVEQQPYDLVLERFSWSWAWIKFPWMPDPLTVEW